MKKTFRLIIAAIAVITASASCQKEITGSNDSNAPSTDGLRVITAVFDGATKSSLDGFTPKFENGDRILITNGKDQPDVREISVDETGKATFTTELTGDLKAVYPYGAEKMDEEELNIVGVKVPASQDGTFAKANIAMATITSGTATFVNQTAVLKFYVDASIGVKSITITSSTTDIAEDSKTITVDPAGDVTLDTVTDDPQKRICYVSVIPGVTASTLTFTSETTTQSTVTNTSKAGVSLASGTMYNAFIPYYIDLGTAGKWGYCNVGAFLPEEAGRYFAWGDVAGQTWNGSNWSGGGFYSIPGVGDPEVLPLKFDAANAYWGSGWRMPTKDEFITLINTTATTKADFADGILTIKDHEDLKFPAAGSGFGSAFLHQNSRGFYRSSTIFNSEKAAILFFTSDEVTPNFNSSSRSYGLSVRPFLGSE